MKKRFYLLSITMIVLWAAKAGAQQKTDLEKLPYQTGAESILKVAGVYATERSDWFFLPGMKTENMGIFRFGPVEFSNGGAKGPKDIPVNRVTFVFDDGAHGRLVGLELHIEKEVEAKKLRSYIWSNYGQPLSFERPAPKDRNRDKVNGYAPFMFKRQGSNQTMIVVDNFPGHGERKGYTIDVFIMDNDVKAPGNGNNETALDALKKNLKRF